jgi:hypothetical protein
MDAVHECSRCGQLAELAANGAVYIDGRNRSVRLCQDCMAIMRDHSPGSATEFFRAFEWHCVKEGQSNV